MGGGNDQCVGPGIDHDVRSILGAHLPSRLPLEKILDDVLDRGCIGVLQRINLDALHTARRRDIECVDYLLDQREKIGAGGNDDGVGGIIPLNGQCIPGGRRLRNLDAVFLQVEPQTGHLSANPLKRGLAGVLLKDRLQHRHNLIGGRMF